MARKNKGQIITKNITDIIGPDMLLYAAATTVRGLPSCIDGLKVTQRKILFSLWKNKTYGNTQKNNKNVGDTATYVPTGDSSIYGALIRMGQIERYKYPLIKSQGNYGYISNGLDTYAAQRYTEGALSDFAKDMYFTEDFESVPFVDEGDPRYAYPSFLPCVVPMSLVLGTNGVGVGYKNNCPPHTLKSIGNAYIKWIEKINSSQEKSNIAIAKGIKLGFPNKTQLIDDKSMVKGLITGKGRVIVEGIVEVQDHSYSRKKLVITELPHLVGVPSFIESVKANPQAKELFSNIHDYSSKEGVLIELIMKQSTNINEALDFLYYGTPFRNAMNYSLLWNVDMSGKRMGIYEIFESHYNLKIANLINHYTKEYNDTYNKIVNYTALKYIVTNKDRRETLFKILNKSDDESIYIHMRKAFSKGIKDYNDNVADFIINSNFRQFLNKADLLNKKIVEYNNKLENSKFIKDNPHLHLVSEINDKIRKWK